MKNFVTYNQCKYSVTLWCFHATIVEMGRKNAFFIDLALHC